MRILITYVARCLALVLAAGLATAVFVRYSPGALVDEREMDQRFAQETIAAIREARADSTLLADWFRLIQAICQGDLGYSSSKDARITDLVAYAAKPTIFAIGAGLACAWSASLFLGILLSGFGRTATGGSGWMVLPDLSASLLLSMPAAVTAYLCLNAGVGAPAVLTMVLTPRLYRFTRNLLRQAYGADHIAMARARGVREWPILRLHVLPAVNPQLFALGAASLSMAVGAAIPVEAILDSAGLGRLAWEAAMARDFPLLVNLTMLIALATATATGISEAAARCWPGSAKAGLQC